MREDFLYVVRLWRDSDGSDAWRASLENVRTGSRKVFASLAALTAFIAEEAKGEWADREG